MVQDDGDGIPWRTLPGFMDAPAATYFTRGSGHSERAQYTERPEDYKNNMVLITLGARISNLLGLDNRIFR